MLYNFFIIITMIFYAFHECFVSAILASLKQVITGLFCLYVVAVCPRGKEVSKDGMKCMACQTGLYREDLLLPHCIACTSGRTTKMPGSVSSSNCICKYVLQERFHYMYFLYVFC